MDHVARGKSSLAFGLACCLALTAAEARALTLGELVVHSRLGQPLRAQLAVATGKGEAIEESCISLAKPVRGSETPVPLISRAKFSVEATDTGQLIRISTLAAIGEPVVKLVLQLNCDGETNVSREFTVLLDPPEYGSPETPVELQPAAEPRRSIEADVAKPDTQARVATKSASPMGPSTSARRAGSERTSKGRRHPPLATAHKSQPRAKPNEFRLKLSTGTIDVSASSKMTEAERLQLREKQLLLEADDQVASILALKNRVQQLEAQLAAMNLKLSAEVPQSVAAPLNRAREKPPVVAEQPAAKAPGRLFFWPGVAVLFALLVLFIVVRNRKRLRESKRQHEMEREYGLHSVAKTPIARPNDIAVARPVFTAMESHEKTAGDDTYYDPNSIFNPPEEKITLTEVDSVVEEADLYMIYGWTQKAIELLLQHVEKSPAEAQPWMMLFDIYHSQQLKDPFEKLARRFHVIFDNPELWDKVRALGRDLEPANNLYACAPGSTGPEAGFIEVDEQPADVSALGDATGAADVAPEPQPQEVLKKFQQGSR